jgi:TetR/AcrR family acrAB operon transcriptional repressor
MERHVVTSQPARARGRRSAEEARATRASLVELAGELFAEHGYLQTSIRDIARCASVTSGAIYGHFRNKAELLAEVINTRTSEQLEADTMGSPDEVDHIETLTRHARRAPTRRQLRALIVQGAAAAQTDQETRDQLRAEQLAHINAWIEGYERDRERLGIDPGVDIPTAVLYTWAVELGLGVLEGIGIEPRSTRAWADIQNRMARSLQLPPDDVKRTRPRRRARADSSPAR